MRAGSSLTCASVFSRSASRSSENASLLAPLLDIPLPKERVLTLAPEELRRRQLAAATNWTVAGAKTQPLVLVFEDLHWADPTTLDVLRGIAERGALVPLYVVATTRPEFRPPWGMRSHHGTISLAPLDHAEVREMVAELSARHALTREVVDDVAARTGGVPLFVEEVTRLLLERGEQGGAQAIPPTLQQSLMARLDQLGSAREVAQIGSVIGRGFSYKLLKAVAGMEDAPLEASLEKLSEADIVLVEGVLPDSDYRFKHALIQDAALRICSRAGARFCTAASPKSCLIMSPPQPSRSCWRITSLRRASPKLPSNGGAKQDSGRWSARRWSKRRSSSRAPSTKSRLCPPIPHCVAGRSSFRLRL